MIREHTMAKGQKDEISDVLKSPFYAQTYYFPGLRDRILGPHSTKLVPVSRFYLKLDPQVVVDFEPSPLEGKFYVEEKRLFFMELGIVYVPIFLGERLTAEQFAERVKQDTNIMRLGRQEIRENGALRKVDIEDLLQSEDMVRFIDQEVMRRIDAREKAHNGNLRGVARVNAIERTKRELVAEIRQKASDGRLGQLFSSEQVAVALGGRD